MEQPPEQGTGVGNRKRRFGPPSARTVLTIVLLYLSVGFLLTFMMRWPIIKPESEPADFLSVVFNPRIYVSALSWPFWLILRLF